MNPRGFEFDTGPAPERPAAQTPEDGRAEVRAAPRAEEDEPRGDEPAEEPGYGHGV